MIPGELDTVVGDIELNVGRATRSVAVTNTGDRPVQIGSHYHFFEVNDALLFDREAGRGFRLNIPAGTAVRFEPGQTRTVEVVAYAGERAVYGLAGPFGFARCILCCFQWGWRNVTSLTCSVTLPATACGSPIPTCGSKSSTTIPSMARR